MYIHNLKLYKVTPKDDENYWMLIQQEMLSPEYQNFLNMFKELKKRKLNFGKINNNFNILSFFCIFLVFFHIFVKN